MAAPVTASPPPVVHHAGKACARPCRGWPGVGPAWTTAAAAAAARPVRSQTVPAHPPNGLTVAPTAAWPDPRAPHATAMNMHITCGPPGAESNLCSAMRKTSKMPPFCPQRCQPVACSLPGIYPIWHHSHTQTLQRSCAPGLLGGWLQGTLGPRRRCHGLAVRSAGDGGSCATGPAR